MKKLSHSRAPLGTCLVIESLTVIINKNLKSLKLNIYEKLIICKINRYSSLKKGHGYGYTLLPSSTPSDTSSHPAHRRQ